jgi:hypothetical protein
MKTIPGALTASLLLYVFGNFAANAAKIEVDLGPSGVIDRRFVGLDQTSLAGTPLAGQSLPVDLSFAANGFLRVFTFAPSLFTDTELDLGGGVTYTSDSQIPSNVPLGTGYFVDESGNQIGATSNLIGYFDTLGPPGARVLVDTQIVFPAVELATPTDVFGVHLDVALPQIDGAFITGGEGSFFFVSVPTLAGRQASVIGVGPGDLPRDIVPEMGNTLALLSLSTVLLLSARTVLANQGATQRRV